MAACMTPYVLKNGTPVPCNKCPACYKRRVSSWSFRLMQQEKVSTCAYFFTLTYDNDHVRRTEKNFLTLSKRDVQLFLKRLRKLCPNDSIKYYICGEYGTQTWRPHYHAIMFNVNIEKVPVAWDLGHVYDRNEDGTDYARVNEATVGYVLKYMCKTQRVPFHKNDDRQPEFALMSKGLGANYLSEDMVRWHKDTTGLDRNGILLNCERMYVNLLDGKKATMPRYYKNKIWSHVERKTIGVISREKMLARQKKEMDSPNYFCNYYESVAAAFRRFQSDADNRKTV